MSTGKTLHDVLVGLPENRRLQIEQRVAELISEEVASYAKPLAMAVMPEADKEADVAIARFAIRVLGQERYDNSPCQASSLELIEIEVAEFRAEVKRLREELRNIANADPSTWDADVRDQFKQWAQNRARAALAGAADQPAAIPCSHPDVAIVIDGGFWFCTCCGETRRVAADQ